MDAVAASPQEAPRTESWRERIVPPVDKPSRHWHISPFVDLFAYQLSWLWILVPLALAGDRHPRDYLGLWAFGMSVSFMHRHYTMPYVYLDRQVFSQHVTRFSLFMALLMIGFVGSALAWSWRAAPGFLRPAELSLLSSSVVLVSFTVVADRRAHRFRASSLVVVALAFVALVVMGAAGLFSGADHARASAAASVGLALVTALVAREVRRSDAERASRVAIPFAAGGAIVAALGVGSLAFADVPLNASPVTGAGLVGVVGAVAALWNVWHTLMQKFGIMRMYAAKSAVPLERRTPAWADRLLIFGSFPFVALYLAPSQRGLLGTIHRNVTQYILPLLDGLTRARPLALPFAGLLAAASIAIFVRYEWRADRLRTWPRLAMGLSLVALNGCFLFLSPIKVYIAYGFSHAVEYCVFVWAFLRRRYANPSPAKPLLGRLLTHPWLAYGLFSLVIGGSYFFVSHGRDFGLHDGRLRLLDIGLGTWMFSFTIWHSMAHFYFDGFLWKMRAPELRANL